MQTTLEHVIPRLTVCVRMEDMDLTALDSSVPMELCLISISSDVKPGTQ